MCALSGRALSAAENKRRSMQYGTAVLLISAVIVKLIGALFKIPLSSAHCLGDEGFGFFSSAYDLFSPLYSLAMAGLPVATARTVSEHTAAGRYRDARLSYRLSRKFFLIAGIIGTAVFAALVIPFVRLTDATGKTAPALFAVAPAVLFSCILSAERGYYEGLNNMLPTAVSELTEALCKLILGLGAAFITVQLTGSTVWGAAAAMAGITVGTLFAFLYTRIYAKLKGDGITAEMLENSPEPQSGAAALKKMILLTLPIALTSLTVNIPPMIDAFTVKSGLEGLINGGTDLRGIYRSVFENGDIPELSAFPVLLYGIRGKAYTVFNLVPAFTSVIGVGAVPAIAAAAARGNTAELKKNINTVLKTAALISLPAACGLIAIGGRITDFLYDTEASAVIGGEMLTLYGFAALFAGFLVPLGGILQAVGRQNAVLLNTAVGTAVKLIVNIIAVSVPKINVMGSALGTVLCFFVIFLLDIAVLIKAVGFAPDSVNVFLKPLASAAFCGLAARLTVMLGSSRGVTLLAVFAAALVYAALIIALKTVSESDFPDSDKGKKLTEFCRKHRIIR